MTPMRSRPLRTLAERRAWLSPRIVLINAPPSPAARGLVAVAPGRRLRNVSATPERRPCRSTSLCAPDVLSCRRGSRSVGGAQAMCSLGLGLGSPPKPSPSAGLHRTRAWTASGRGHRALRSLVLRHRARGGKSPLGPGRQRFGFGPYRPPSEFWVHWDHRSCSVAAFGGCAKGSRRCSLRRLAWRRSPVGAARWCSRSRARVGPAPLAVTGWAIGPEVRHRGELRPVGGPRLRRELKPPRTGGFARAYGIDEPRLRIEACPAGTVRATQDHLTEF